MDKDHLLVCPKLDHTCKELPTVLGCQKINGVNPRSAIRQQQQSIYKQRTIGHIDRYEVISYI
jgi:hypothetical protein